MLGPNRVSQYSLKRSPGHHMSHLRGSDGASPKPWVSILKPSNLDDLGVPPFSETFNYMCIYIYNVIITKTPPNKKKRIGVLFPFFCWTQLGS